MVTPQGAIHTARTEVPRGTLDDLVRRVRTPIETAAASGFRPSSALATSLRELDRLLITPIATWLPASPDAEVVVISHGPLALVPFAALEDDKKRPLAERHTLAFAPAASIYQYTRDKLRTASERTPRALIVADPTPPKDSGIGRLPWARQEGQLVAARLHGFAVRVLSGSTASEAVVKREAGEFSLLHFATHGLIAPDHPLASSLALAGGEGEDGYLRADEVFNLELNAQLVVLNSHRNHLLVTICGALITQSPAAPVACSGPPGCARLLLLDRFFSCLQGKL